MDGQTIFVGAMLLLLVFFMAMMWFKPDKLRDLMEADRKHKEDLGKMTGNAAGAIDKVISALFKKK